MSPIDYWADDYFFVHMIEHILIAFFAPILIVAGAPWLPLLHGLPVGPRRRLLRAVLLGRFSQPPAGGRTVRRQSVDGADLLQRWSWCSGTSRRSSTPREENQTGPHLADARQLLRHRGPLLAPDHPVVPVPAEGVTALAGRRHHLDQRRHVRPGHVALALHGEPAGTRSTPTCPGVTLSPYADQQIGAAILWICGDFWAVPALAVTIRRAIDSEGGFSLGVDRLFHRDPGPSLEAFRALAGRSRTERDGADSGGHRRHRSRLRSPADCITEMVDDRQRKRNLRLNQEPSVWPCRRSGLGTLGRTGRLA